jgi:hypothetical protein
MKDIDFLTKNGRVILDQRHPRRGCTMLWYFVSAGLGILAGILIGRVLQKRGEPERINEAIDDAIKTERAEVRKKEEANLQTSHQEVAKFLSNHIQAPGVTWDIVELYNVRSKISLRLLLGLGQDSPILLTAILASHPSGADGTFFRMARPANMSSPPNLITPQPDWDVGIAQIRQKILIVPQILMFSVIPRAYRQAQSESMKTQMNPGLGMPQTSSPPATPNDEPQQPLVQVEHETEAQRLEDADPEIQSRAAAALAVAKSHSHNNAGEFQQPAADTAPAETEAPRPERKTLAWTPKGG